MPPLTGGLFSFNLSAYLCIFRMTIAIIINKIHMYKYHLSVLTVCSADEDPGEIQAIITILDLSDFPWNESRRTRVSLDARKGT